MRIARCTERLVQQCRHVSTEAALRQVRVLPDSNLETFRKAYENEEPVLLPRQALKSLPAIRKWFSTTRQGSHLNLAYLAKYGAVPVPLEFTNGTSFARMEQSFSYFLECLAASNSRFITWSDNYRNSFYSPSYSVPGGVRIRLVAGRRKSTFFNPSPPTSAKTQVYLAQAPISDLPRALRADLPIPELILQVGKGDIYDSSIWLGMPPTNTPLHRDPNPNLFVQMVGKKKVRLYRPHIGRGILAQVKEMTGGDGNQAIRGEEMMQGAERAALDAQVWGQGSEVKDRTWEAQLQGGDALFIPKGWWHSVKSVGGSSINGSVNWWFR